MKISQILVFALLAASVPSHLQAQTEAAPTENVADPTVETPEIPAVPSPDELARLCGEGFYDAVMARVTPFIAAAQESEPPGKIDPRLFYWRGLAALRVGWFGMAREDMNAALQAKVEAKESPQSVIEKIDRIEAVLPPQVFEVKSGENTVFRVYYTQNDPVTRAVIETLPAAYRISADLFGADVIEQPVFIFNTYAQMLAFMAARGSTRAASWAWAYGG
ncbi:MAG TPA: hypothetical protein VF627_01460, partial [Abditibacterium sp.]